MITQKEIAEMLGISRTTVARALKEDSSIKDETRKKVLDLMRETKYEKNYLGSFLASKKKIVHAFIVKSKNAFYTNEIQRGIENAQKEYKRFGLEIKIYIHDINKPNSQTEAVYNLLKNKKKIDGLIIVPLEKDKLYKILKNHLKEIPIVSLTIPLHKNISHMGINYKKQGEIVAGILSHCLRDSEKLIILDNGDDKLSSKPYLDGFLERIKKESRLNILGPYKCNGIEESLKLLNEIDNQENIKAIFSNRYAQDIISMLSDDFLKDKKIVLSGMGVKVKKLLEEKKVVATVMEEIYEQSYFVGKFIFEEIQENAKNRKIIKETVPKVIYLENLKK